MSHVLLCQGVATAIPLREKSVHCVVTSPPYYGLRDYGTAAWAGGDAACEHTGVARRCDAPGRHDKQSTQKGSSSDRVRNVCLHCGAIRMDAQLGLEALHDCHGAFTGQPCGGCFICHMRAVFKEVWRVMRDDATLWCNMGDSYTSGGRSSYGPGTNKGQPKNAQRPTQPESLQPKNLLGMPWRLALALQQDGWVLRSEIIWDKMNPMPESCKDRPTKAHEQVFLFAKQGRYFYDQEAVREPTPRSVTPEQYATMLQGTGESWYPRVGTNHGDDSSTKHGSKFHSVAPPTGRNARTVWHIPSAAFAGGHFACFPPELARRCILAGAPAQVCRQCGAPWVRKTEKPVGYPTGSYHSHELDGIAYGLRQKGHGPKNLAPGMQPYTTGFTPTCTCAAPTAPSIVLDPFCGSGTSLLVARELGRHGVGVDLSWPYLHAIARERLGLTALAAWTGRSAQASPVSYGVLPLFA